MTELKTHEAIEAHILSLNLESCPARLVFVDDKKPGIPSGTYEQNDAGMWRRIGDIPT